MPLKPGDFLDIEEPSTHGGVGHKLVGSGAGVGCLWDVRRDLVGKPARI